MRLTVLATAPTAQPQALLGSVIETFSPSLDVRLQVQGGALVATTVRPYFWQDGAWWPLGKDANAGVAGVAASGAVPRAHGRYEIQRTDLWWCLVLEGGTIGDIEAAYLDGVDRD